MRSAKSGIQAPTCFAGNDRQRRNDREDERRRTIVSREIDGATTRRKSVAKLVTLQLDVGLATLIARRLSIPSHSGIIFRRNRRAVGKVKRLDKSARFKVNIRLLQCR